MDVKLFPENFKTSVIEELKSKLDKAEHAIGTVAFFTLGGQQSIELFDAKEWAPFKSGWMCIDVHYPTNLDNVSAIVDKFGVEFWLHVDKVTPIMQKKDFTRRSAKFKVPDGLLHSKFLVLDYEGGTSEAILGSHNWTLSALGGSNIEQSIVIAADTNDPIIVQLKSMLETTKNKCIYYGKKTLDEWKQIQEEFYQPDVRKFRLDIKSGDLEDEFLLYSTDVLKEVKRGISVLIETNDKVAYNSVIEKSVKNGGQNAIMEDVQVFKHSSGDNYDLIADRSEKVTCLDDVFYYHISKLSGSENEFLDHVSEHVEKIERWVPKKLEDSDSEKLAHLFGVKTDQLALEPLDNHQIKTLMKHKNKNLPWSLVKQPKK